MEARTAGNRGNPYDFTSPVKDPARFIGRKKELDEISYYLRLALAPKPQFFNVAVVGDRASGKTSLLNRVGFTASEQGFLVVRVALNAEIVENDVLLFKEVFDGILTQGADHGMYGGVKGAIYRAFRRALDTLDVGVEIPFGFGGAYISLRKTGKGPTLSQSVLVSDFRAVWTEAQKSVLRGIVLLIDEADLISRNEALLQKIRNVFSELTGFILFFAGTPAMFPSLSRVFSPLPRQFIKVNLTNFSSPSETSECLLSPLSDKERESFNQSCIWDIHSLTAGSPYEINLVGHFMYRRWAEGGSKQIGLSQEVLEQVFDQVDRFRSGRDVSIAGAIRSLSSGSLSVLLCVVELSGQSLESICQYSLLDVLRLEPPIPPEKHLAETASRVVELTTHHIVANSDGVVRFLGDAFDLLYLKYLCAARGIRTLDMVGSVEPLSPIVRVQNRIVVNLLLDGFQNYEVFIRFEDRVTIYGGASARSLLVFRALIGPEGVTISPNDIMQRAQTDRIPQTFRFQVKVPWAVNGFCSCVFLHSDSEVQRFEQRFRILSHQLTLQGYAFPPRDAISLFIEGRELQQTGDSAGAIRAFDSALDLFPHLETALMGKANLAVAQKDWETALTLVNLVLETEPNWYEVLRMRATLLLDLNRTDQAVDFLTRLCNRYSSHGELWRFKGVGLLRLGRAQEAKSALRQATEIDPGDSHAHELYGVAFELLGDMASAMQEAVVGLALDPALIDARLCRARILLGQGNALGALKEIDSGLEFSPGNPALRTMKAEILRALGDTPSLANVETVDVLAGIVPQAESRATKSDQSTGTGAAPPTDSEE
jgi:tetratricopeptide (TPR) repeat protein